MIDDHNSTAEVNSILSTSLDDDCRSKINIDIPDEEAEKALILISKEAFEKRSLSPNASSLNEDSYQLNQDGKEDRSIRKNQTIYGSGETEESESDSENSSEDEDSSDENDHEVFENCIMQQRWKELDKYGSSSHNLLNTEGRTNGNKSYRLTAPINLSPNSPSLNHGPSSNMYCLNNVDSFMLGINGPPSNSAINMSLQHMSSIKPLSSILSMEKDPLYHMLSDKSDSLYCGMPLENHNLHLNSSSMNFDYPKEQRHHQFAGSDIQSQFHLNMMMSGHGRDSLAISNIPRAQLPDFRCSYCNKYYTNQSSLRSHLKKHMKSDDKKFKCEKCPYSSQYQKNLLKHSQINHEDFHDLEQCRCDICDRLFTTEFLLKDHLRMHTNDNTYQCHQCGKKLKTKLKLRYHADVHNPEKPYVCDIDSCDRAFRTPKYLKNHKDEFHKLQPKKHFCPVENCKLVFQRKSHLKRHMSMHDGEKNYHCHWPDCNRSFRSQETLNVHLIRHTGEKPFRCELCEYSCRQKASLNYHCRNAHAKDCERLLGLKAFQVDGRTPSTRPVGRPPRNKQVMTTFEGLNENEVRFKSKKEIDLNEDHSLTEVFKKPAPVEENDFLKKEVFMIVEDVLNNPPRDYRDSPEFSLEELCLLEMSIKSKRGRKRKVLKELDALLAQSVIDNENFFEEDEEDKDSSTVIDNDDDSTSQYTPSMMHSSPIDGRKIQSLVGHGDLKGSFSAHHSTSRCINGTLGRFDSSYILNNDGTSRKSLSESNTPLSGQIKTEADDDLSDDADSEEGSPSRKQPNILNHPIDNIVSPDMTKPYLKDLTIDYLQMNSKIQNDQRVQKNHPGPFISPAVSSSDITSSTKTSLDPNEGSSLKSQPKSSIVENNNQPKSLDSSGYSSGHDSKDNLNNLNPFNGLSSSTNQVTTSFLDKSSVAAEMAALSASAALLNSDFYNNCQQSVDNSRTLMENDFSPSEEMYKSGLEYHVRSSLTALESKYMEPGGYQGSSSRPDSGTGQEMTGMDAFSHLWSTASGIAGDCLTMNPNGTSSGTSPSRFDSRSMRNGFGDYCNLPQSPTVAAAADFYSQMTASANYDKYSSLYGCRDSFYENPSPASRGISAFHSGSNHYGERNYLPSSSPFYRQTLSGQYNQRYTQPGPSAADYFSMGRQFSTNGFSGNPFSPGSDPYRNSVLNNIPPFNQYPF